MPKLEGNRFEGIVSKIDSKVLVKNKWPNFFFFSSKNNMLIANIMTSLYIYAGRTNNNWIILLKAIGQENSRKPEKFTVELFNLFRGGGVVGCGKRNKPPIKRHMMNNCNQNGEYY